MVNNKKLLSICQAFNLKCEILDINEIKSGHINDTYLIKTNGIENYVLQRLNTYVFKNAELVIENKVLISDFLTRENNLLKMPYSSIFFFKSKTNNYYFKDKTNHYWTIQNYIESSITYDIVPNTKVIYEAGKLYGNFLLSTKHLDTLLVHETLPNFHNVPYRFNQFRNALESALVKRVESAQSTIDFAFKQEKEVSILARLKIEGLFPIRITHNDTKLSNILFDSNDNGLAVIDLDTVMPGIVHFDFGDAVRSMCTNRLEDNTDFSNIKFNLEYYQSFCKGYAESTKGMITEKEIEYLPLGVKTIIFIMGLRFLTDYLNNDKYYKTTYASHNLDRAKNQFALCDDVISQYDELKHITYSTFKLNNIS